MRGGQVVLTAAVVLAGLSGCVERVMKIRTQPPGALVVVNDEEVGVSPVQFSFLWYGDYDIIIRKPGYETLKTHYRVNPPWFQWPVVDLFTEVLWPATLRDVHELPEYALSPAETPRAEELIDRAVQTRERTLFDAPAAPVSAAAAGAGAGAGE